MAEPGSQPSLPPLGYGILAQSSPLGTLVFLLWRMVQTPLPMGLLGEAKGACRRDSKCPLFVIIIQLVYGLALPPRFVTLLVGSVEVFQSSSPKPSLPPGRHEAVFLSCVPCQNSLGSFAAVLRFVLSICLRGIVAAQLLPRLLPQSWAAIN